MARMIPSRIPSTVKSPGEVEVFERLRNDPVTGDWIVLHSLDIAAHQTQQTGEADFVVLVPNHGVLCLEVKGCRSLRLESGWWYYGKELKPDKRGPFRQAASAMYSIKDYLAGRDERLEKLLYWSAVIFPFVDVPFESAEWHSWQLIDHSQLGKTPLSTKLVNVLENAHLWIAGRESAKWYQPITSRPSSAMAKLAANLLRPRFEVYQSPADRAARRIAEVKRYTEEQFVALDAMEDNQQVIFTGPAGTGKTTLAIEAARRGALEGHSVLFLCFNRMLGSWLKEEIAGMPRVTVRTLHGHMLSVIGERPPANAASEYWSKQLPEHASYALIDAPAESDNLFDLLVIDETQDILSPAYLDFLDLCLSRGLRTGRWLMFGDFELQMIYGEQASEVRELLDHRFGHVPRYSLRYNCRHTPRIAETIHLLGQMNPGYKRILRPDNEAEPKILIYSSENHKRRLLAKSLEELLDEGIAPEDITILTPHAGDATVSALPGVEWSNRLVPMSQLARAGQDGKGRIRYGTIHSFKGMEAPAVVVVGVDEIASERGASLLYIALSRALHRLVILLSEDLRIQLLAALQSHAAGGIHG